jgi:hypothetical protein
MTKQKITKSPCCNASLIIENGDEKRCDVCDIIVFVKDSKGMWIDVSISKASKVTYIPID